MFQDALRYCYPFLTKYTVNRQQQKFLYKTKTRSRTASILFTILQVRRGGPHHDILGLKGVLQRGQRISLHKEVHREHKGVQVTLGTVSS